MSGPLAVLRIQGSTIINRLNIYYMKRIKENEAEYRSEISRIYRGDKKMIEFCISDADIIAKDADGRLFVIEKPEIQKSFWHGYSSCGQGPEYDEAREFENNFCEETFYRNNLRDTLRSIDTLKDTSLNNFCISRSYKGSVRDCKIWHWSTYSWWEELPRESEKMPDSTRLVLIAAYKQEYERLKKRLHTWWKRYGKDYIHTGVYWLDE